MDDARRALLGDERCQRVVDLVDHRQLARLLLVPLPVPPLQLAGDVAVVTGQIGEPGGLEIDGVQRGHRVDDRSAGGGPGIGRQGTLGDVPVAHHVAVDVAHHVERGTVDGAVLAQAERRRHGHRAVLQTGDDAELPADVMGAGEHVAERRPAQHEPGTVTGDDAVGEVGVTAGDDVEAERGHGSLDVVEQPCRHAVAVDAGDVVFGDHPPDGSKEVLDSVGPWPLPM